MFKDYYSILEIPPDSSTDKIIKAFRTQAKKWHPDVNNSKDANQRMQDIIEAYQILLNPEMKSKYDSEYSNYYAFKKDQTNGNYRESYTFIDSELHNWMQEAASKSSKNFDYFITDLNKLLKAAAREALIPVKVTLSIIAFFTVISLLATFLSSFEENPPGYNPPKSLPAFSPNQELANHIYTDFSPPDSLPTFNPNDKFTNHKILCFGSFSLPHSLERKNETASDNSIESFTPTNAHNISNILTKATYQQWGLNIQDSEAKKKYVRILVRTEKITNNDFPFYLDGRQIENSELKDYSNSYYSKIEESLKSLGITIIQKSHFNLLKIKNQNALGIEYTRKLNNNPTVCVQAYFFRNEDILYSVVLSFRENESAYWQNDLMKFLNSLVLEIPLKMSCINSIRPN